MVFLGALVGVFLLGIMWAATRSAQAEALPYIDLSRREPLSAAPAKVVPLRLAVAAIISPQGTAESYAALADYLSKKLNRPVELVQRRTYAEVNELIAENAVDLAFVCTSAYILGSDSFGMQLLVAPQVDGQKVYQSVLIVPADSTATSMADLAGATFAFTDPISFSGRTYPTYLLQQLGTTPEVFFNRTFFTYSHDKAIDAVANKLADGAAVDSLVLRYAFENDPTLENKIKIIHTSPSFGIPPVVVSPNQSPYLKSVLRDTLLEMTANAEGLRILEKLGFDGFTILDDSAYDSAREVVVQTGVQLQ